MKNCFQETSSPASGLPDFTAIDDPNVPEMATGFERLGVFRPSFRGHKSAVPSTASCFASLFSFSHQFEHEKRPEHLKVARKIPP